MALKREPEKSLSEKQRLAREQHVYATELKKELAHYERYGMDERAADVRRELKRLAGREKAVPSEGLEKAVPQEPSEKAVPSVPLETTKEEAPERK